MAVQQVSTLLTTQHFESRKHGVRAMRKCHKSKMVTVSKKKNGSKRSSKNESNQIFGGTLAPWV